MAAQTIGVCDRIVLKRAVMARAARVMTGPGGEGRERFGRFYLQELINSGGMADIWLATDSQGKPYALRRLHPRLRFNFVARRRFVRGCEILAQIHDHEHIIGYVEHGKAGGTMYLVMDYVEAASLKELYANHDPLLLENVAQILIDMASGLEHLHQNGFMHLDFKPENVLVTRNAGVRLIDFDLAQPLPKKPKKMSKNPGTPAYMAPEQLQRLPIDGRVDIFAYGVSAYELLTNQKPFPGESPDEILQRQMDDSTFVTPRKHNPEIPAAMEQVILKCLERDPNKRYPFLSVLSREVKAALYV
jgi:serine/threonine protein kinase